MKIVSAPPDPLTRSLPVRGGATDEVVGETEPMETLLKKPEIKRDTEGRFERHGKALSKTSRKKKNSNTLPIKNSDKFIPVNKAGRPKGSLNKVTVALKEAILAAGEEVGNELDGNGLTSYLKTLARENSSAYAGLLGKVLPSTLQMSDSDRGKSAGITFQRIIVWPDGHREVEGVTPKQLPGPTQEHD
jgi:hypothetical protein